MAPDSQAPPGVWQDERVQSWDDLSKVLHSLTLMPLKKEQGGHRRSSYVFRGMSNSCWPLKTSLERLGSIPEKVEEAALRAFERYAPRGTFSQHSEWERLAVAQHNGLPTRVLDWTVSPLVAAHFATWEAEFRNEDGVIWCVNADIVRDQVLPEHLRDHLREKKAFVYSVPLLERHFPSLETFDHMQGKTGDVMIFFEPPSIDARIQNQFGILSAMNGPSKSHDAFLQQCSPTRPGLVCRIVIDHSAKPEIRDILDQNNITERMLFPGLPGLCDWLRRYYGPA
jgi:hypothetical protein